MTFREFIEEADKELSEKMKASESKETSEYVSLSLDKNHYINLYHIVTTGEPRWTADVWNDYVMKTHSVSKIMADSINWSKNCLSGLDHICPETDAFRLYETHKNEILMSIEESWR